MCCHLGCKHRDADPNGVDDGWKTHDKPWVQNVSSLPPGTGVGACMRADKDAKVCQAAGRRIR
jgi:hypothetical protein